MRIGDERNEWADIQRGVRQGCVLSLDLFSTYSQAGSCNFCIKQKRKYNEAVILLDKLEESENKKRDLPNPPSCTNQSHMSCNIKRSVQPQKPASSLDSQNHDPYIQPPDVPPRISGQRTLDQTVPFQDCIGAEDSMETDNFVDANGASMLSQNRKILENNSLLKNMTYEADIQTQNGFTISTPLIPIRARVAYEKGIPGLKIYYVDFEEEEEMSNGDQEVNYQPNSASQGQSQRTTNHRLPILSPDQQQTTPPPENFPPINLIAVSTATHQRALYNLSPHTIPSPIPTSNLYSSTTSYPPPTSSQSSIKFFSPHLMHFSINPHAHHPRQPYHRMHRTQHPAKRP